ncbi:UNVERIFIED_CONTAM: hypothetical protein Slati_0986600 [Sesamum latifolium]|uniref:Integrase catalytic domain-containing protein n=1 Tax=Sesamum latifolium TaxID=2727402 RepID=A0AAW2XRB6_9LAMI
MGGHQDQNQSHPFFNAKRNVIQEVLYTSSTQMPISRRRHTCAQGNTQRILRIPHRDLGISQQSTEGWVLLAHYEARPPWGMDIVGPFPLAPGQKKFLLVAIDYFTKWVEAEPVACITEGEVMKFIWKNIICRFGLPRELISDNAQQFQAEEYKTGVLDCT